jgi:hypothetical protein
METKLSSPSEQKVFINSENMATFICPQCNNAVVKDLGAQRKADHAVRIKCRCKCGHTYRVLLERRSYFRKACMLEGVYTFSISGGPERRGRMNIKDISQSGLLIETEAPPLFSVGDKLGLEIHLDADDESPVFEEGVVRRIRGKRVGIEFLSREHYGRLGALFI